MCLALPMRVQDLLQLIPEEELNVLPVETQVDKFSKYLGATGAK